MSELLEIMGHFVCYDLWVQCKRFPVVEITQILSSVNRIHFVFATMYTQMHVHHILANAIHFTVIAFKIMGITGYGIKLFWFAKTCRMCLMCPMCRMCRMCRMCLMCRMFRMCRMHGIQVHGPHC
jgi:hypothetical protein